MTQAWNWNIAKLWFPANCIFVGMLWTSFPSLQLLSVGMVTVLKNLTNFFVIFGDITIYGKRYGPGKVIVTAWASQPCWIACHAA